MYTVKGKLNNTEYYRFEFWKDRWMYLIVFLVPTLLAIFPIDSLSMQPFFPDMSEGEVLLIQWVIYFLVGMITLTAFLFVSAAIQKRASLEMREYLFSDEKLTIRSQTGERYVQWPEVVRIVEKKLHSLSS